MAILIRNAYVFAPKELGVTDVLMVGEKILAVGPNLSVNLPGLSVIDATGFILAPGFVDAHVHVLGGGGVNGKKLLGEIDKLKNGTIAAAEAGGGRLTLGYLNGYEGERLYKAVALFKQQNADVNLQITSGSHDELTELLASGRADLVLNLQRHVVAEPYAQQLAVSLPCFIEISSVYGGFGGSRAELEDLKGIPCIFVAGEKEQATETAFYRKNLGFEHELLFARSMEEAHLMAAAGNGFVFTAKNKTLAAAGDGVKLLALYNNGKRVYKDYYFFWKKDNGNRYIRSFIDIALKVFGMDGKKFISCTDKWH